MAKPIILVLFEKKRSIFTDEDKLNISSYTVEKIEYENEMKVFDYIRINEAKAIVVSSKTNPTLLENSLINGIEVENLDIKVFDQDDYQFFVDENLMIQSQRMKNFDIIISEQLKTQEDYYQGFYEKRSKKEIQLLLIKLNRLNAIISTYKKLGVPCSEKYKEYLENFNYDVFLNNTNELIEEKYYE